MLRWITILFSMGSMLWQISAQAAGIDWDVKLRQEFQSQSSYAGGAGMAALNVEAPLSNHHLTPLLAAARVHWNELSEETRALVRPWMLRPTSVSGNEDPAWRYPAGATVSVQVTPHFKIHFLDKKTYPNEANAATQAFVNSVQAVLEEVWTKEYSLGYMTVPSDALSTPDNGGDGSYDVYLTNLGPSAFYGYVQPEDYSNETARPYGAYSYMVLDNDYTDSVFNAYSNPILPLEVTVAHEYFHAIQFGYSYAEDNAFMEQTATWMEDVVYPDVHDNYQYLGELYTDTNGDGQYTEGETYVDRNSNQQRDRGSPDYPEAPLDAFDTPKRIQYGRFIWIHYLTQTYSDVVVRNIWETCSKIPGDTYAAINTVLQAKGTSLARAFQDYATWGYDKNTFIDGANYPLVRVDRTQSGNSVSFSSANSPSLSSISGAVPQLHLSTIYTQILNPSGIYSFTSSGGSAALTMLVDTGNGLLQHQVVSLSSGDGTWTAPAGAVKAISVISNVSSATDGMSWQFFSGGLTKKKSGGGAFDIVIPLLLLWRFRRRNVYQAL